MSSKPERTVKKYLVFTFFKFIKQENFVHLEISS